MGGVGGGVMEREGDEGRRRVRAERRRKAGLADAILPPGKATIQLGKSESGAERGGK